jgi:hypothetical protein
VLFNCGASVPPGGATKLLFTSACENAAWRALRKCETPIWTPAEQLVLAPQAAAGLLRAAEQLAPPVRERRWPLG